MRLDSHRNTCKDQFSFKKAVDNLTCKITKNSVVGRDIDGSLVVISAKGA